MATRVKLGPKAASFSDRESGLKLLPGMDKPLPEPITQKIREWLMQGGLVKFEVEDDEEVATTNNKPTAQDLEKLQEHLLKSTEKELVAMAQEALGEVPKYNKKADLIEVLMEKARSEADK